MMAQGWWIATGAAGCIALIAGIADRARARRRNLDKPGWVPWQLILVLALIATLALGLIAATGRLDLPTGYYSVPRVSH